MPNAFLLDDLTTALLWAVMNLDEPLINDDAILASVHHRLDHDDVMPPSGARVDQARELTTASRMWLGSDLCARHVLRHLGALTDIPAFWTREQRGEEASTWLLFDHKYRYLQALSEQFARQSVSRGFCIPPDSVAASPPGERLLLLLATALMESFGIRVDVCADPEYGATEGFVLDPARRAIVANWVDADRIWHVDVTSYRPTIRLFDDVVAHTRHHSAIRAATPLHRLRTLADYLELSWPWLVHRCAQLGEYGLAGLAEPRSRLLSTAGVDRACRYLGQFSIDGG